MKQLTPRQGTKILSSRFRLRVLLETTHTPPGDENFFTLFPSFTVTMKQLTPRQGTKTAISHSCIASTSYETTYTPPGDENDSVSLLPALADFETTHTPSGDENISGSRSLHGIQWKQLTPRQGTKTPVRLRMSYSYRNNLHPVRGRKKLSCQPSFAHFLKQLTPRQGTKTMCLCTVLNFVKETTYTPSGDENALTQAAPKLVQRKQLTPRQGTKKAPYPCG